ncbi:cell division protein ZapE [Brevundimonas aveniformis]|uniref:cell division protein ZapE n=1 Tax=Brevundimonas aveniformis TaxID=370977 RepID=UPI002490235F|nr:cell division protein ZapE [Brevundimonas aveniformis]
MPIDVAEAYQSLIDQGRLRPDPSQRPALDALAEVEAEIEARPKIRLFGGKPVRGLYLWGPPGRGKSRLMDLFFQTVDEPKKRRAHFHAFMAEVHARIKVWRAGDKAERKRVFGTHRGDDPIAPLARLIASEARLLCFDELQVTDIADAMILGRLFEALFEDGVVLVCTSNRPPDDLYKDGINRQLFTPFIDLIKERCRLVELNGSHDWRLERLRSAQVWFTPDQRPAFNALWDELKARAHEAPATLEVAGRQVLIARSAGSMARETFDALCDRPLGPSDYLALAARFDTLFLEDVPVLTPDRREAARRFVTLIDTLYEAHARLIVLAAAEPDALYPKGVGAFEFERTASRLHEMRSRDWLKNKSRRRS